MHTGFLSGGDPVGINPVFSDKYLVQAMMPLRAMCLVDRLYTSRKGIGQWEITSRNIKGVFM